MKSFDANEFVKWLDRGRSGKLSVRANRSSSARGHTIRSYSSSSSLQNVPFNESMIPSPVEMGRRISESPRTLFRPISRQKRSRFFGDDYSSPDEESTKRLREVCDEASEMVLEDPDAVQRIQSSPIADINSVQELMSFSVQTPNGHHVTIGKYLLTFYFLLKKS